ncbi:hypothetical protein LDENG_00167410 [Lucifuga dentata]|nr:hypothetical protein LDENG_00167410 [Lucifuga dentata]
MEVPPRNLQDLKDLLLTPWCQIPQGHLQRSCGVHASTGQSCFGGTRGTYTILDR